MASKCGFYARDSLTCRSCPKKTDCQTILDQVGDISDILQRHDRIMQDAVSTPISSQKPKENACEARTVLSSEKRTDEILKKLSHPLKRIASVLLKAGSLRREALDISKLSGSTRFVTQSIVRSLPGSFETILKTVVRDSRVDSAHVRTVAVSTLALHKIFETFEVVVLEGSIYIKKDSKE